jgi:zinc transporter 6
LKYIAEYLPNSNCGSNSTSNINGNNSNSVNDNEESCASKLLDKCHNPHDQELVLSKNGNLKLHKHSHAHGHSHLHSHGRHQAVVNAHREHHEHHENEMNDIRSNAWMAVMGDGLHNFSDGLAIGAAFATSLTTGITTSIAVFCHELPHEIGNFAVLRSAGMPIKRALIFNVVSSVLCFIGVMVGLMLGRFESFQSFILLFIAGVFLYISLVDMV